MSLTPNSAKSPEESNPNSRAGIVPQTFQKERQALDRLLASGEFHRSPNLEKILNYLCNQYFAGQGNLVKEYTIATEALERKEDFDPKRDSIVRVEMHRLRRRLKEYYATRGASEPVRIHFPDKSYVPDFVGETAATTLPAPATEPAQVPADNSVWVRVQQHNHPTPSWLLPAIAAVAVVAACVAWVLMHPAAEPEPVTDAPVATLATARTASDAGTFSLPAAGSEYRILAGRPKGRYPDRYGVVWQGDDYFNGGTAMPVEAEVRGRGFDANLFANKREGDFTYDIPLQPGDYELMLLFAETNFGEGNMFGGGEFNRQFHILINGRPELSSFDVLAEAHDTKTATARLFKDIHPARDGKLHLRFQASLTGKAFVNAIHIRPGVPGKLRPIRIVCRPHSYRDQDNNIWEPDHFYRGGVQITRPTGSPNMRDPDLFRGERYGKFSYSIPVPPGKYQARLYFTEYWWGSDRPGGGGVGTRVFDVFCNFRPLLLNLDILKRNPKDRHLIETFHNLEPNLESQLVFDFEPHANFALLNAIEIAEESDVLPPR